MRFSVRALWSGGSIVGWIVGLVGGAQWVYGIAVSREAEIVIKLPWYILVILGLVIVLVSSLRKAYTMHRDETAALKGEMESIKRDSAAKVRNILRQSNIPKQPLSLVSEFKVERRGVDDIQTETILSHLECYVSFGVLSIKNTSQESLSVEVEYKILSGNVPLLSRNITDNTPHMANGKVIRDLELNPDGNYDLRFVTYGMVDIFNMGFGFPSWFLSKEKKMGMRREGRISKIKLQQGLKITPYIEVEIKIIGVSTYDDTRFLEHIYQCRIEANTETNEMSITKTKEQFL